MAKHIKSRLLVVKEHDVSEKITCGIPQEDNFIEMQHMFDPDEEGTSSSQRVVLQFPGVLDCCVLCLEECWIFFNQVGKTWQEIFQQYGKRFFIINYALGLLHKGKGRTVETTFGRKVSPRLQEELLKWTEKETKDKSARLQIEPMDFFHCLYEIQEEEYAKRITDDLQ